MCQQMCGLIRNEASHGNRPGVRHHHRGRRSRPTRRSTLMLGGTATQGGGGLHVGTAVDLPEQIVRHPFDRHEHRRRGRGNARVSARRPGRRRYLISRPWSSTSMAVICRRVPTTVRLPPPNRLANASLTKAHGPVRRPGGRPRRTPGPPRTGCTGRAGDPLRRSACRWP